MVSFLGATRSGCSPSSTSSNAEWRKPRSGSTSPSVSSPKSATAGGGDLRTELAEHKDALDQELEAVRREVAELAERMDFAERLLAQNREGQRIGPGK